MITISATAANELESTMEGIYFVVFVSFEFDTGLL